MTDQTGLTEQLERCEGLMLQGQDEQAAELLAHLAEDAEEYVDKNCPTTDELQWFSFPTLFERLAYRRVEKDPRELRSVGEPLDRLYNDLALANVHVGDYDAAAAALKGAIRWNPMDCGSRLNLADLYRVDGDRQEFLALSFSVFERASEARHLARAFVNFASWFEVSDRSPRRPPRPCARRATSACGTVPSRRRLTRPPAPTATPTWSTTPRCASFLPPRGCLTVPTPTLPSACSCAGDAARAGDRNTAATLTLRARDLVGEPACKALLELINSTDEDGEE